MGDPIRKPRPTRAELAANHRAQTIGAQRDWAQTATGEAMKRNQPQPQRRTTRTNRAPAVESPERRAQPQTRQPKESGYQEDPGWGSLFRRDAQGNQPNYTGTVNDPDGDELQIAVWIRTPKGGGAKYLRVHLEPPYAPDDDDDPIQGDDNDLDDVADDLEDIPF